MAADLRAQGKDDTTGADLFAAAKLAVVGEFERSRVICARLPRHSGSAELDYAAFVRGLIREGLLDAAEGLLSEASAALQRAGADDAREALLGEALRWFPDNPAFATDYAMLASTRGDWPEAASRWGAVRTRRPDWEHAHVRSIQALRESGHVDEAAAMGKIAIDRFPHDDALALEYAQTVHYQGDLAAAARTWADVRARFPDRFEAYVWGAVAMRGCHDPVGEEAVLAAAMERFPSHPSLAVQFADSAMARQDWREAIRRLELVRQRFPDYADGYTVGAQALLRSGDAIAAQALMADACRRFPADAGVLWQSARVAMQCEDWLEALQHLQRVKCLAPASPGLDYDIATATLAMQLERDDFAQPASIVVAPPEPVPGSTAPQPSDAAASLRELAMGFESLGDNCEFGLVQRNVGAEPLGLLRWASIDPTKLVAALRTQFAGIGNAEHTVIATVEHHSEYMLEDPRYFTMHTFIGIGQTEPEKLLVQMRRRLVFLRQKLIEDLQAAEKIFVYKRGDGVLSDREITEIHDAMLAYGPATLLCIRQPDATHPHMSVAKVSDRLMIGHLAGLTFDPGRVRSPLHQSAWIEVCRAAWRIVHQGD